MLDADWNEVGEYEKLSDYWQIGTAVFADARLKGERTQEQLAALYRMLFDAFCGALGIRDGTMSRQRRETGIWSL